MDKITNYFKCLVEEIKTTDILHRIVSAALFSLAMTFALMLAAFLLAFALNLILPVCLIVFLIVMIATVWAFLC